MGALNDKTKNYLHRRTIVQVDDNRILLDDGVSINLTGNESDRLNKLFAKGRPAEEAIKQPNKE